MSKKVTIGKLIRVCPSGRHAWFESNVGPVRKPYRPAKVVNISDAVQRLLGGQ